MHARTESSFCHSDFLDTLEYLPERFVCTLASSPSYTDRISSCSSSIRPHGSQRTSCQNYSDSPSPAILPAHMRCHRLPRHFRRDQSHLHLDTPRLRDLWVPLRSGSPRADPSPAFLLLWWNLGGGICPVLVTVGW